MRVEHDGITLWYGTADAPAPEAQVSSETPIAITIGVFPVDASNSVTVIYRINQGEVNRVPARYVKNGQNMQAQYFRATLPALKPGDKVEYMTLCRCAGRQVPPHQPDKSLEFPSSFTVVKAGTTVKNTPPVSATNQLTSPNTRIAQKPTSEKQTSEKQTSDSSIPKLQLSSKQKSRLKTLTLSISGASQKEKLAQLFTEASGEFTPLKARLEESEEFGNTSIQHLTFYNDIAELVDDEENLVAALVHNDKVHCLRDVALNFRKPDLKALIRTVGIPKEFKIEDEDIDDEGLDDGELDDEKAADKKVVVESEEERLERFATKIGDRLFRMAPTAVIHRMVKDEEVVTDDQNVRHGVDSFLNDHPDLDFRKTSVLQVLQSPDCLRSVPEAHREKVVDGLKKLQRTTLLSPKAEAVPALLKANLTSAYAINEVPMENFVSLYADQLGGENAARAVHLNAQNINVRNEEAFIALRQAVTGAPVRMIHGDMLTDTRMAEVASLVKQKNIPINFETLFGSVDLCECKHCNSVYSPAAYLVELFQYLRNNNLDPDHNKTGKDGISGTPLKKLFRRRPDLGHLQLTCENTNTLIPYIDLVNEVMESFVVNLNDYEADEHSPKQAKIAVYDVDDESSGELLSEPQHTNYKAYRILKKAVYPVCKLPYHQPIDTIRQYLSYLGTSRHEILETFRADVRLKLKEDADEVEMQQATRKQELRIQAGDRAIDAEFLHLTEEEFVILTKESFYTKEWYELNEGEDFSLSQYQEKIGLKKTWEYYGLKSENQMIGELKWIKPSQDSGLVGFLRRVNILYVDLIELLKTRYINPNYLSGKALAYMNSIRYSYRFLQSLVNEGETELKLKYQKLVEFLQDSLPKRSKRFDKDYVECWVYKYFKKIGKLIVLEDDSSCQCIEGDIRLYVIHIGDDAPSYHDLYLENTCQIYIANSNPRRYVGYLDSSSSKLILDNDYTKNIYIHSGDFNGTNGVGGKVETQGEDLIFYLRSGSPFSCNYQDKCDISTTQLKHLNGTDLETAEYDRMHRFIRLWCKLGWTIEEVDQAITGIGQSSQNEPFIAHWALPSNHFVALLPSEEPDDDDDDDASELTFNDTFTANRPCIKPEVDCKPEPISQVTQEINPYLIQQLAAVKKLLDITGLELAKLLTYWTQIGIYGENSLYKRLFLKYNLVAVDDVFEEDIYGTYLIQEETISDHLPILMAAVKADVPMIETVMSLGDIPDELTLETVSEIYRYLLLAKTLGLRVRELPGVLALLQDLAHPFDKPTQTLRFYELFSRIDNSDFSPRELNYMLRDEDDPLRPLRPSMADIFELAISLRDSLLQIEIDYPDIEKDEEATEELLRSTLSLLYDGAIVENIIALLHGTTIYEDNTRRKYSTKLDNTDQIAITDFLLAERKKEEAEPGGEFQTFLQRVQFSGTKGLQITGILSEADQAKVTALAELIQDTDARDKFLIAVNKIYAQPTTFFDDVLFTLFDKEPDGIEAAKTVLLAEDFTVTEDPQLNEEEPDNVEDSEGTNDPIPNSSFQKRAFLARAFMPYLREELRQRLVIQTLASNLGLEFDITQLLVMDVIKTPAGDSLYQEIIRLKEQKDPEVEEQIWQGFFVPEKDGKYLFLLEAEGDATLTIKGYSLWSQPIRTDEEAINFYQSEKHLFLKAGRAYPFVLQGHDEDEKGNIIGLFMKFNGQAQVEISDKVLFPALRTETFRQAYIQLQKAGMLVDGFSIKQEGMEFFLDFPGHFEALDFNSLTFPQWLRLESFYRLQRSLPQTELSLVDFLRWANQAEDADSEPSLVMQINMLTGWKESEVYKMLLPKHFNLSHPEHFQDERNLLKLQETLEIAKKIGVGMGDLFNWGKPTSHFKRTRKIAGNIRETIRARYSQEEWEEAIKPTHDQLRENQKQALIAYLLAQPVLMDWGVRDADSLFEFFLIDVQMDACMETSRIKQAISSVQLFVQRCFLGLEKNHGVKPKALDRQRWEWMSRYRVWEANRKVFLYPENWIRPELRDTKSPFFEELESELLQNDISHNTVKSALARYISQVDEVANLEVIGQFIEEKPDSNILHVVGRTRNAPYFFYYRYYEFENKYWYPWIKIEVDIPSLDIEDSQGNLKENGAYITPVVWKNRLLIFFPEFTQKEWSSPLKDKVKVADSAQHNEIGDSLPLCYWEIKMGWSEYKEGKWTPKKLSKMAIETIVFRDFEGNRHLLDIFSEKEKFIFTPIVNDDYMNISIQPYYLGKTLKICEDLWTYKFSDPTLDYRFLKRTIDPEQEVRGLNKAFKFDGTQVKVKRWVTNTTNTFMSSLPYQFHRRVNNDSEWLLPIQSSNFSQAPIQLRGLYFASDSGDKDKISFSGQDYAFYHTRTDRLLGLLRTDRLNKIFSDAIPINNNHYGSNDGLHYHELRRPYSIYNWELLFHSVASLADSLSKAQRFEEALTWWHYIFDPINIKDDLKKVWKFKPFRKKIDSKNVLDQILGELDPNTEDEAISEWRNNPFEPHVIARRRPAAYMKWVVMKYIDNLIAWGDYLFRQDTIETLNQATQLYVLAGHILGPRPEFIPKRGKIQPKSYLDLKNEWDAFSNAIVDLELLFPFSSQIEASGVFDGEAHYVNIYGFATALYFCIPDNPKLLEYWDIVADRLFKIRHCLNIEGVFRKLSLFEPPIDPALLVQAAAQGLSISSVLNDLSTPMPNYRFNYLLQRALEVTSEVKSLGSALLSALEKKDGENLSLLRAQHDIRIQNLIMEVRKKQLEEAESSLDSLEQNRKAPEYRLQHYLQLAGEEVSVPTIDAEFTEVENQMPEVKEESGMKLIPFEQEDLKKAAEARNYQIAVGAVEALASVLHALPFVAADVKPLGVGIGVGYGGSNFGNVTQAVARGLRIKADDLTYQSGRAGKKTNFLRQLQDRIFQANLAGHDLMQIDKQVTTQKIRKELAQLEIDNHQIQIEQTEEVEEFIRSKYSNEKLYQWMSDQLKDLYYQAYSFAYDLAKKAEKVFRFEMGLSTSDFIKFGYWDSAKDGFLAGEQLYLALKHLENAYVEKKPHDYEITKHISLQQLNPLALIQLKEQGSCEFDLPEETFDLDYPGHYKRRIKTVSVSIPCIVGPYTSLNCTLRLIKHEYRNSKIAASASDYAKKLEEADERFIFNPIPTTAIAVSQGQNDSGVFELNFRDERYLPFEGAGAISTWRLELPQEFRQFDYQTITDVILHLRYTACEGGDTLKASALEHLMGYVEDASELSKREGLFRMLSLRHEFPSEWHRFLHPEPEAESQVLVLGNLKERLPFFANNQQVNRLEIQSVMLFAPIEGLTVSFLRSDQTENLNAENAELALELVAGTPIEQLQQYVATDLAEDLNGLWALQVDPTELLTADVLQNAWLVIRYQLELQS